MEGLFFRGETLLKHWDKLKYTPTKLTEEVYTDLETHVKNYRPKTKKRQYAVDPIRVARLDIIPYVGTKSILFKALVNGSTGKKYNSIVTFYDIEFEDDESPTNVTFTASDGKIYHIKPIDLQKNNLRVRCNCLDFYWRFNWYNNTEKSLYGPRRPPYTRKTDWMPPVNPDEVSGFCKHLIKTFNAMDQARIFNRSPSI